MSQPRDRLLTAAALAELERHEVVGGELVQKASPSFAHGSSTAGRDLSHKRRTYHQARVGHYWVVDPLNRTLTVYRWLEAGYLLLLVAVPGEVARVEPFDAIELDVGDIFGMPAREP